MTAQLFCWLDSTYEGPSTSASTSMVTLPKYLSLDLFFSSSFLPKNSTHITVCVHVRVYISVGRHAYACALYMQVCVCVHIRTWGAKTYFLRQSLSLNLELPIQLDTWPASPRDPASASQEPGLQAHTTGLALNVGSRDPNSALHACIANGLIIEPAP